MSLMNSQINFRSVGSWSSMVKHFVSVPCVQEGETLYFLSKVKLAVCDEILPAINMSEQSGNEFQSSAAHGGQLLRSDYCGSREIVGWVEI